MRKERFSRKTGVPRARGGGACSAGSVPGTPDGDTAARSPDSATTTGIASVRFAAGVAETSTPARSPPQHRVAAPALAARWQTFEQHQTARATVVIRAEAPCDASALSASTARSAEDTSRFRFTTGRLDRHPRGDKRRSRRSREPHVLVDQGERERRVLRPGRADPTARPQVREQAIEDHGQVDILAVRPPGATLRVVAEAVRLPGDREAELRPS